MHELREVFDEEGRDVHVVIVDHLVQQPYARLVTTTHQLASVVLCF